MAHTFTVTITDEQYKGMQYVAADPDVWVTNMVHARANSGMQDVQAVYIEYKTQRGEATAAGGLDGHVNAAFNEKIVETAAQRNANAGPPGSE